MYTHRCIEKCYFRSRTWEINEKMIQLPGEVIPPHFKAVNPSSVEPEKTEETNEKQTLSEISKEIEDHERRMILTRMNKDDLVSEATRLGLSDDANLIAFRKAELIDMILSRKENPMAKKESEAIEDDILG